MWVWMFMWGLNMDGFDYVKVEGFQWGKNFTNIDVTNAPMVGERRPPN